MKKLILSTVGLFFLFVATAGAGETNKCHLVYIQPVDSVPGVTVSEIYWKVFPASYREGFQELASKSKHFEKGFEVFKARFAILQEMPNTPKAFQTLAVGTWLFPVLRGTEFFKDIAGGCGEEVFIREKQVKNELGFYETAYRSVVKPIRTEEGEARDIARVEPKAPVKEQVPQDVAQTQAQETAVIVRQEDDGSLAERVFMEKLEEIQTQLEQLPHTVSEKVGISASNAVGVVFYDFVAWFVWLPYLALAVVAIVFLVLAGMFFRHQKHSKELRDERKEWRDKQKAREDENARRRSSVLNK